MTFTLGLSGWTAKDWSGGAAFSALAGYIGNSLNSHFQAHLKDVRYATITNLKENLALPNREFQESLATLYRRGLGFYDLAADVVRYRELMAFPIPEELIAPSEVEQEAMELLVSDKLANLEICLIEDDPLADQWSGKATTPRKYTRKKAHPSLVLGEAGNVLHAECNCRTFSRFGLKAGPCEHLLALQMAMIKKQSAEVTIKK
jgi:predicted nucleic acid-binding Zn finger protein